MQKITLITGPTSGIGEITAIELAKKGHHVYSLARNQQKADMVIAQIKAAKSDAQVSYVACDLANMNSVRQAAAELKNQLSHIDVLINNAGGIFPNKQKTVDGFDMGFATNHLGHFLLVNELQELLIASKARIISVSSMAHFGAKINWDDLQMERSYSAFGMYANVKLFNVWFTRELVQRFGAQGLQAYCLHPGVVRTKFAHEYKGFLKKLVELAGIFMISPYKGAKTTLYLATQPLKEEWNGRYFKNEKPAKMSRLAQSKSQSARLWDYSMQALKIG
jgi:NAD(P)-dependent dehydrogenase (short-subunit alcohol dehydrogenase family)